MSVIFYSVAGEGMGHSTRSEVVLRHLLKKKYKIVIFSYERAFQYLKKRFANRKNVLDIVEISGINLVYEDNELKIGKTIMRESKKVRSMAFEDTRTYGDYVLTYMPKLFISDYEPVSYAVAKALKIPLIDIHNQGILTKCVHEKPVSDSPQLKVLNLNPMDGDYTIITSFTRLPIKERWKQRSHIIGPILRKEILDAKPRSGKKILVYQTSTSNTAMFDLLKRTKEQYVIYGFNKEGVDKNLHFKKPGVKDFSKDLANSKAVITNGGHTLVSEAIYLKKPVYSVPVKRQIEQEVNGYYLKKLGYGHTSKEVDFDNLEYFLNNLDRYKENLANFAMTVNDFTILDQKIKEFTSKYDVPPRAKMLGQLKSSYDQINNVLLKLAKRRKKLRKTISRKAKDTIKEFEDRFKPR